MPFQVLPLTPAIMRKMVSHLNMALLADRALWCSYLLSFYGLLRKSSSVPKSSSYNVNKVLVRHNISVDVVNNMVYIYLGHGKTNNFFTREVIIPVAGNSDPAMDPVRHLYALFSGVIPVLTSFFICPGTVY